MDMKLDVTNWDERTLAMAMKAAFGERISGVTMWDDVAQIGVHFFEPYTTADETAAQAIVDGAGDLIANRDYTGTLTDDEWSTGLSTTWEG